MLHVQCYDWITFDHYGSLFFIFNNFSFIVQWLNIFIFIKVFKRWHLIKVSVYHIQNISVQCSIMHLWLPQWPSFPVRHLLYLAQWYIFFITAKAFGALMGIFNNELEAWWILQLQVLVVNVLKVNEAFEVLECWS